MFTPKEVFQSACFLMYLLVFLLLIFVVTLASIPHFKNQNAFQVKLPLREGKCFKIVIHYYQSITHDND
jgi:hypothetical protein